MFLEGFDQHNRWFLSSLLLSMQMTDTAPFKVLKTHGLLVDQEGNKISKSSPIQNNDDNGESAAEMQYMLNPEDFIEGSTKQDGSRRFGYGIDVMRAWVATKDTDKKMLV